MKRIIVLLMFVLLTACTTASRPNVVDNSADDVVQEEVKEEFSIGETVDYTYINDYFDFRIDLDSDWYIASESELLEIQAASIETLDNEQVKSTFEEGQAAFVFFAQKIETNENIQVAVEGLPLANLKAEQILKSSIDGIKDTFAELGCEVESIEIIDINLDGKTEKALFSKINIEGRNVIQKQIGIVKDKYYSTITVAAFDEESADEMISRISSAK